jgi:hypothetical protein
METMKTLAMRKAVRDYRSEQISEAELNRVLYAGSLAPVGLAAFENYRLTVVQGQRLEIIMMSNTIYGAPTLIICNRLLGLPDRFSPVADILLGYTDGPSVERELAITLKVNRL